jgi:hypothetical protein
VLGLLLGSSCASEQLVPSEVEVRASPLELGCAAVPADVFGDVTSVLASIEPLDPSQPQPYGSDACAGFVFEFDNPDEEPLRGAWVQASAWSGAGSTALSESQCSGRTVEADYWGYKDREWSKLTSASETARYERDESSATGYCRLEALIEHAGAFEKLRISARVSDGVETYPMYACVW